MKELWRRMTGWGDLRESFDPGTDDPGYAQEFFEAVDRTQALGVPVPPIRLLVRKNCVEQRALVPALQEFLGPYREEEALGQGFGINVNLIPYLYEKTGIPFTLTIGWFEYLGKQNFQHSEDFLRKLLKEGIASLSPDGLPLHIWLTSPACEVLDVTLMTTLAAVTGHADFSGAIIYISNQESSPSVTYHPTVTGVDFLDKIGATVPFGRSTRT
jgi:hypothetical protein